MRSCKIRTFPSNISCVPHESSDADYPRGAVNNCPPRTIPPNPSIPKTAPHHYFTLLQWILGLNCGRQTFITILAAAERSLAEHQSQLGKKKLKIKEVNIHEQWKDLVFRSLGELQAWEFLQCTSDLSPGGEANINPNECGGEMWLKQSR